jgi:hypothetical protein
MPSPPRDARPLGRQSKGQTRRYTKTPQQQPRSNPNHSRKQANSPSRIDNSVSSALDDADWVELERRALSAGGDR